MVDDDIGVIQAVGYALTTTLPEFTIVTFSGMEECQAQLVACNPVVVSVDWRMKGATGDDVMRAFRPKLPAAKWILFTATPEGFPLQRSLFNGVNACVGKMSGFDHLTTAVREVLAGHSYFCPRAQRALAQAVKAAEPVVTETEGRILRCIAQGKEAKEIAHELNLSVHTVHNHFASIRQKTGAQSMVHMRDFAVERGIAPGN